MRFWFFSFALVILAHGSPPSASAAARRPAIRAPLPATLSAAGAKDKPRHQIIVKYAYKSERKARLRGKNVLKKQAEAVSAIAGAYRLKLAKGQRTKFAPLDKATVRLMRSRNQTEVEIQQERLAGLAEVKPMAAARLAAATTDDPGLSRTVIVDLASEAEVNRALKKLGRGPSLKGSNLKIVAAARNQRLRGAAPGDYPDDPHYVGGNQWALNALQLASIWNDARNGTRGNATTWIAVIDSGVDYNHPELAANIRVNPAEVPSNGQDDDDNGVVDDVIGFDFVTETSSCTADDCDGLIDWDPMDGQGHGTLVAGIIAAVANNGTGTAGVCPECRIMPVRAGFRNADGYAEFLTSDAVEAFYYATFNGADVINASFGGTEDSFFLRQAVAEAVRQGVLVVAAAGNTGDETLFYPAAYPSAISVTAYDRNDALLPSATRGTWVTTAAPGVDILSTFPTQLGDPFQLMTGTSAAAAHISGLAGLMLSSPAYRAQGRKRYRPQLVRDAITATQRALASRPAAAVFPAAYLEFIANFAPPVEGTPTPTPPPGATATPTPPPGATSTPTPTPPPGATATPTPALTPPPDNGITQGWQVLLYQQGWGRYPGGAGALCTISRARSGGTVVPSGSCQYLNLGYYPDRLAALSNDTWAGLVTTDDCVSCSTPQAPGLTIYTGRPGSALPGRLPLLLDSASKILPFGENFLILGQKAGRSQLLSFNRQTTAITTLGAYDGLLDISLGGGKIFGLTAASVITFSAEGTPEREVVLVESGGNRLVADADGQLLVGTKYIKYYPEGGMFTARWRRVDPQGRTVREVLPDATDISFAPDGTAAFSTSDGRVWLSDKNFINPALWHTGTFPSVAQFVKVVPIASHQIGVTNGTTATSTGFVLSLTPQITGVAAPVVRLDRLELLWDRPDSFTVQGMTANGLMPIPFTEEVIGAPGDLLKRSIITFQPADVTNIRITGFQGGRVRPAMLNSIALWGWDVE